MQMLTANAEKALGKRAAGYVNDRNYSTNGNRLMLVPDDERTPVGVARTLTRVYGVPTVGETGESHWLVPVGHFTKDEL